MTRAGSTDLLQGNELLAVDAALERMPSRVRIGRNPRRRVTVEMDGMSLAARLESRDGVGIVRFDRPVVVPRDSLLVIGPHRFTAMAVLDDLDPSARAHLARRLGGASRGTAVRTLAALPVRPEDAANDSVRPGISPAARRLLERFDQVPPHAVALRKRGLEPVVRELVQAGEILELADGHLIRRDACEDAMRLVRAHEDGLTAREGALAWACSHGRARAILDRLVADGRALRREKRYYRQGQP